MTFNIGSQTGGVFNNVHGDQHVHGGQHGLIISDEAARVAVRQLRTALLGAPLGASACTTVLGHLDEIEAEVRKNEPNKPVVATILGRVTHILVSAGTLAASARDIVQPISALV